MKKSFVLFVLAIIFFPQILLAQYRLELVHQTHFNSFTNLLVLDNKMWSEFSDGPLHFDGTEWKQVSQSYGQYMGQLRGIQRDDGTFLVVHNVSNRAYTWNQENESFLHVNSPIWNPISTQIYSESMIYVGTSISHHYDDHGRLYLWNGAEEFELLANWHRSNFLYLHAIDPVNVLLLVSQREGDDVLYNLMRYNGEDFVVLHVFENLSLDPFDALMRIQSIDNNLFFITTSVMSIIV